MKLAANVVWRSGVPLAVQAARGTTANESKEVVEPTVGGGRGDRRECGAARGGAGKTDGMYEFSENEAIMIGWVCRRRSWRPQWRD